LTPAIRPLPRVGDAEGAPPDLATPTRVETVALRTLDRGEQDGYAGYSKFDALESPIVRALSFGWWPLRLVWTQVVTRAPINLRSLLLVREAINPEAPALFARANLDCLAMGWRGPFAERACRCLDWLLAHDASGQGGYHGRCWGYHHAWQSPGFYRPRNAPNCYVTAIVAGALLHGHRLLGRDEYLDAARSAAQFILRDLPILQESEEEKCIAYVPHLRGRFQVININALAASVLGEVGGLTGDAEALAQARKLMTFVARRRTPYGAWHYTVDPRHSLVAHDNYHTGMILDALLAYERATGDLRFQADYSAGLRYYREHLFLASGAPKWTSTRIWPHDVHGAAQGTLTFSLAGDLATASRIASWGLTHLYKGDGSFAYQRGRLITKRFTLLHWCNGWMARALAALLLAGQRSGRPRHT
jgi:hypothetical protein